MPSLMRIFTASDKYVRFAARTAETSRVQNKQVITSITSSTTTTPASASLAIGSVMH